VQQVITDIARWRGCLLGLACGDAVGTSVEFSPRGSFAPVTDMTGGGPFGLAAGEWTDDTSMALCLATSLVYKNGFDATDQMNRYCNWRSTGYMSSNGRCFDIGLTVATALKRYQVTGDPFAGDTDPHTAGNGALMRLAPVPMFYACNAAATWHDAGESTRTTHGAMEAIECSRLFAMLLRNALMGTPKKGLLHFEAPEPFSGKVAAIARGEFLGKTGQQIRGSGYCVASLESALWAFFSTDSLEEAILAATNLGDDADTTAAICGQLAGAFYGEQAIPGEWLQKLVMREEIARLADELHSASRHPG
jgi:ADP-ribosyl-[dinitrogen reductase] hydrolase